MRTAPRTAFVFLLLGVAIVAAQEKKPEKKGPAPRLTVARPFTLVSGEKAKVTLRGQNLEALSGVRMHEPKSSAKLVGKPTKSAVPNNHVPEKVGDWEATVEVDLAAELPGRWVGLTVTGPGGESNLLKIPVADATPRVPEKEPNNSIRQPQTVKLPCVVEGTIERDRDVDVFQFEGKQGEAVTVDLEAARFGSPLDGLLTLYDSDRRILAICDDCNGTTDPQLRLTLPRDGIYFVMLIDANDFGAAPYVYRLTLSK
ncbi:MAG: PPC domain-containing protein [Gemmataceae bacterium]